VFNFLLNKNDATFSIVLRQKVRATCMEIVSLRQATDLDGICIGTYGGHFILVAPTSSGTIDFLGWCALQSGSWGPLTQRSGAVCSLPCTTSAATINGSTASRLACTSDMRWGDVINKFYPANFNGALGYSELNYRF
jgi:hypothetical protein